MSKKTLWRWGNLCLTAALLWFIWGNSTLSAEDSAAVSGGLLAWLQSVCPALAALTEYLLRKFAHFSEYAVLGGLVAWGCILWEIPRGTRILVPMFVSVMTALTDESIQLFTPGRSGEVRDVWIDFLGGCTGLLFFWMLLWMTRYFKEKQR